MSLAWNSPINPRSRKYRAAHLWFSPKGDLLRVHRRDADWRAVQRGTIQHEILEGEAAAMFAEDDALEIQVNCRADAAELSDPVRYGLAVSFEVAEGVGIPIYDEIRTRLYAPVRITPPR